VCTAADFGGDIVLGTAEVHREHRGTFADEHFGHRLTQTLAGTGDDRHLPDMASGHSSESTATDMTCDARRHLADPE
jgi:hypothetical protein